MWPFKRKKPEVTPERQGTKCPYCSSQNTRTISRDVTQDSGHVKTWRGQRFANYRCSNCGKEFYADEPEQNLKTPGDNPLIEDEEELRAAEEELKRQTDAGRDRRYWPNG
jgi:DNA-directed RNA polymerase subunit RPC12/RpoP